MSRGRRAAPPCSERVLGARDAAAFDARSRRARAGTPAARCARDRLGADEAARVELHEAVEAALRAARSCRRARGRRAAARPRGAACRARRGRRAGGRAARRPRAARRQIAHGVARRAVELEAVRAGVAGARDQHAQAGQRASRRTRRSAARASSAATSGARIASLAGPCSASRPVSSLRVPRPRRGRAAWPHDPAVVLLDVRGVHAEQQRVGGEAVDGDVVDHAAVLVAEQAVAHAPDLQRGDGAADADARRRRSRPAPRSWIWPMCETSKSPARSRTAACSSRIERVLHRHLEARERDHARAERAVRLVERRARAGRSCADPTGSVGARACCAAAS